MWNSRFWRIIMATLSIFLKENVPSPVSTTIFGVEDIEVNDFEKFKFLGQEIQPSKNLTISLGLASFPEDAKNKESLIALADSALYQAKAAGKNRTYIYSKETAKP